MISHVVYTTSVLLKQQVNVMACMCMRVGLAVPVLGVGLGLAHDDPSLGLLHLDRELVHLVQLLHSQREKEGVASKHHQAVGKKKTGAGK